jgi:HAD superfamily phosphoserine phosphatase-like hydrolase
MAISIYDMDRTITRAGTWGPWLRFWLLRHAPWRVLLLPGVAIVAVLYGRGRIGRGTLKAWAHRLLMGGRLRRLHVATAAKAYAAQVVQSGCFPAALSHIADDRAAGRRLVLATASNAYYAQAIGAALGFDAVISTPSAHDGEWLGWQLGGDNCYGEAKAAAVAAWLAAHGEPDESLRFHSDHHSDLPVFTLVAARGGEAVPVNPTPQLRAAAAEQGWPCLTWGEVKSSLFEHA